MPHTRRYERFQIKVPVYVTAADGSTFRKTIHLESRDVSAGGLSFETSQKVPLEADSRIVISAIGDLTGPVLIQGRVAHREKNPENGRYTIGVEFTEFVNITRDDLIRHIEAWRPRSS